VRYSGEAAGTETGFGGGGGNRPPGATLSWAIAVSGPPASQTVQRAARSRGLTTISQRAYEVYFAQSRRCPLRRTHPRRRERKAGLVGTRWASEEKWLLPGRWAGNVSPARWFGRMMLFGSGLLAESAPDRRGPDRHRRSAAGGRACVAGTRRGTRGRDTIVVGGPPDHPCRGR